MWSKHVPSLGIHTKLEVRGICCISNKWISVLKCELTLWIHPGKACRRKESVLVNPTRKRTYPGLRAHSWPLSIGDHMSPIYSNS